MARLLAQFVQSFIQAIQVLSMEVNEFCGVIPDLQAFDLTERL